MLYRNLRLIELRYIEVLLYYKTSFHVSKTLLGVQVQALVASPPEIIHLNYLFFKKHNTKMQLTTVFVLFYVFSIT